MLHSLESVAGTCRACGPPCCGHTQVLRPASWMDAPPNQRPGAAFSLLQYSAMLVRGAVPCSGLAERQTKFALCCAHVSDVATLAPWMLCSGAWALCQLPRMAPACGHSSKQGATPAVLLERRKFGAVGWNIKYDFSDGDLGCSLEIVRGQLAETVSTRSASAGILTCHSLSMGTARHDFSAAQCWQHCVSGPGLVGPVPTGFQGGSHAAYLVLEGCCSC